MSLEKITDKPYALWVMSGDFFWNAELSMDHFALDCSGQVILDVMDDRESLDRPLEVRQNIKNTLPLCFKLRGVTMNL